MYNRRNTLSVGASILLAGMTSSLAYAADDGFASLCDRKGQDRQDRKQMHVCVDMTDPARVVAQSQKVLLANRPTIVHVLAPEKVGLDVRLGGGAGLEEQSTSGTRAPTTPTPPPPPEGDDHGQTRNIQDPNAPTPTVPEGGPKAAAPQTRFTAPPGQQLLQYVFPPRSAAEGQKSVDLTVTMWKLGTGARVWEQAAPAWAQALEHILIPDREGAIALDELDVAARQKAVMESERKVSDLEAKLKADADSAKKTDLDTLSTLQKDLETARVEYQRAVTRRATDQAELALDREALVGLTELVSPDVVRKARGRDFADLSFEGLEHKQTNVAEVASKVAAIKGRIEVSRDIALAPYPLIYDKGVIGSINIGTSVVLSPRQSTYDTEDVTGADGSTSSTIIETTGGAVDVELVATYTHYFWAVPDLSSMPYFGVSAGLSFADLSAESAPGSVYLGLSGGFKHVALGGYVLVRKVDELRPGLEPGDTLTTGEDVPLVSGYRPGAAVMLTITPDLFTIKR